MKTIGYISVFGGFLFAALSAGGNHHPLNEFTAAAGLGGMQISWKEVMSLILMLAGGILLLISRGKEESSLRNS